MRKKTIVWIDDEPLYIEALQQALIDIIGANVINLRNQNEVRANTRLLRSADLIILDLILPGESGDDFSHFKGMELLAEIRIQKNIRVPIIILSVLADSQILEKLYKKYEVNGIFIKPILPSEFIVAIQSALGVSA